MLLTVVINGQEVPLALWTVALFVIVTVLLLGFIRRFRQGWSAPGGTIPLALALLAAELWLIAREAKVLQSFSGGVQILDTRVSYTTADALRLLEALGREGRAYYAAFQWGLDSWSPPAFAFLLSSVAFYTLPRQRAVFASYLILAYLFLGCASNFLMPFVSLNYPTIETTFLKSLVYGLPWLDFGKHLIHGSAWLFIIGSWVETVWRRKRVV